MREATLELAAQDPECYAVLKARGLASASPANVA